MPDALEVPDAFKERILLSDGQDTAFTRLYDLLGNTPWPKGEFTATDADLALQGEFTATGWFGSGTAGMLK